MDEATLLAMLEGGETQYVEFKREFPRTAKNLAKEIPAFATSNAGTILVGVDDPGIVIGLEEAESREGRRSLIGRVEGICSTSISPTTSPRISFMRIDAQWVMIIEVEKGTEPIYYADGRPYLRQISAARVAAPDEVRTLVIGDEHIRRIEALEARKTPDQSTAAAIAGQGDLATMNLAQLFELFERVSITSTRNL